MLSSATGSLKKETAVFLKNSCRKRIGKYFFKKSSSFNPCFCRALNNIDSVSMPCFKITVL